MTSGETIAAISSATGPAVRMIVRLSGPEAFAIARTPWAGDLPSHASAARGAVILNDLHIPAWCYSFKSPRSYTGQDTIEFHIPGNPLLAKMLLEELFRAGARPAAPGEFTAQAYFNGRLDLTEAEGVAATIAAGNEQELSAARRLMSGELTRRTAPAIETLADTLALIEVGIDFSDEDVSFLPAAEVSTRIAAVEHILRRLLDESSRFERLTHEPTVVLAGRPNAGKSTLLNALAGHERAIVSPVAGTTRDVLSADVVLPRGMIRLMDIAGLEEPGEPSGSPDETSEHHLIDNKMRAHALRALAEADHMLYVREANDSRPVLPLPRSADLNVVSKCDLNNLGQFRASDLVGSAPRTIFPQVVESVRDADPTRIAQGHLAQGHSPPPEQPAPIFVSALTGVGIPELRATLDKICFGDSSATASLSLNARHVQAIEEAHASLSRATAQIDGGAEFIALELRQALDALGQISGQISPDDLLGRVFSAFCIGK